jgi:hypothetical protein
MTSKTQSTMPNNVRYSWKVKRIHRKKSIASKKKSMTSKQPDRRTGRFFARSAWSRVHWDLGWLFGGLRTLTALL